MSMIARPREYISSGMAASDAELEAIADQLNIRAQLDLKLLKLSNGQTRRARLARALLAKPELLILDDPYSGLDITGREELNHTLETVSTSGTQLILLLNTETPEWVKQTFTLPSRDPLEQKVPQTPAVQLPVSASHRPALEYHDVTVKHGGNIILNRINWTVNIGERWALIGPNGSGKTTLLSLACGDHPAAFGNDVRLFGKRRGTGESIWDVKRANRHRLARVASIFHRTHESLASRRNRLPRQPYADTIHTRTKSGSAEALRGIRHRRYSSTQVRATFHGYATAGIVHSRDHQKAVLTDSR